jgi:hypothetical protein
VVFKYFNNQIKLKDNVFQFGKRTNQALEYMKSKKEIAQYSTRDLSHEMYFPRRKF